MPAASDLELHRDNTALVQTLAEVVAIASCIPCRRDTLANAVVQSCCQLPGHGTVVIRIHDSPNVDVEAGLKQVLI